MTMPKVDKEHQQIFITYARLDDEPQPTVDGRERVGFVGFFRECLEHSLKQLGDPVIKIWWDREKLQKREQFAPELERQAALSDFLIVIMSENWLNRDWCRRELESFGRRWAAAGEEARVRARIIVVHKQHTSRSNHHHLLQGQEGYRFFSFEQDNRTGGREQPYFGGGIRIDGRFFQEVWWLANELHAAATGGTHADARKGNSSLGWQVARNGRVIFVAQPASDTRIDYDRIINDLTARGFSVVPASDIPFDHTATAFIDDALAKAEFAVHLIGESPGFMPEGTQDGIVKLQLQRAATRARTDSEVSREPLFKRILWAPKILAKANSDDPTATEPRDPLEVVSTRTERLDSDNIVSDPITPFLNFLLRYLERTSPRHCEPVDTLSPGAPVYIEHTEKDFEYADELAALLSERSLKPEFPSFEGPDRERKNRKILQSCDAVAICWGSETDTWAKAVGFRIKDLRPRLHNRGFTSALIVAPPEARHKPRLIRFPPMGVDIALDLTQRQKPSSEDLDPWLGPLSRSTPGSEAN
jgi:hypothetical protein